MMKKIKLCAMLVAITTAFLACKKDPVPPAATFTPTTSDLLSSSGWKYSSIIRDPAYNGVSDIFAQKQACEKDNILTFQSNNIGTADEGASKCAEEDPQTKIFTWVLNPTGTILTITDSDGSNSMNIIELTDSKLIMNSVQTINGAKYTTTVTLVH